MNLLEKNKFHVEPQDLYFGISPQELFEFLGNYDSPCTHRAYRQDLKAFVNFMELAFPNIQSFMQVERVHIVAYKQYLIESGHTPKSINRKLSGPSSFFEYLVEKGLLQNNPSQHVKRPKQHVHRPTNDLTDAQVLELLAAVDASTSSSAPLHRLVIYLLFTTGLRKAEVRSIKLQQLKTKQGYRVLEVRAKGNKALLKVLHPQCCEVLDAYLEWMHTLKAPMGPEDYLLRPTRNPTNPQFLNKPLDPKSIDYIFKIYAKVAGISERISPHSARATYIGSALENGVDLYVVSQDVGHESVKTTQEYNKRKLKLSLRPVHHLGFLEKK